MKKYIASWRYYFFLIFFSLASLLGLRVLFMLLNGEVKYEDNEALDKMLVIITSTVIIIVLSTWILSCLRMISQLIRNKKSLLTITPSGIENTLVFINLFAFIIVAPVKLIPWESVKYYDGDDAPYIRVNVNMVTAGWFAKLLLRVLGYHFCYSFVKPAVSVDDVEDYEYRFASKETL